ncbi:MAG: hypothetical protein ACYTFT_06030 [Planctomycetota bacterium]
MAPDKDQTGIRKALRQRTERVPLRALEKRGFKNVQVLDMRTIERIMHEIVDGALERRGKTMATAERKAFESEAKDEFLRLLKEHKQLKQQKGESDRQKDGLQAEVNKLRRELKSIDASTYNLNAESLAELETRVRAVLKGFMNDEKRRGLADRGPAALKGLGELEHELNRIVDRMISSQRDRYVDQERLEHLKKISILERRLNKLNKALKTTETALIKVAEAKSIDGGMASIYDSIQGLSLGDVDFARKTELLQEVFVQNLEIQGKEILEADRTPVAPPPRVAPPPPPDFTPPMAPMITDTAF